MMPSSRGIWEVWEARSWQNFAVSVDATSQTITMTVAWRFLMQTSSTPVREAPAVAAQRSRWHPIICPVSYLANGNGSYLFQRELLLSPVSFNEGNSVPGIAHGVVIEHEEVA